MCTWPIIASASGHGSMFELCMIIVCLFAKKKLTGFCFSVISDWVSDVLSSRVFAHTNKLTYTIYLLNPLIITIIYGMSETSTHSDPVLGVS
jgi:peptidoglycan/LPS O-acetylase OafA/YrhL